MSDRQYFSTMFRLRRRNGKGSWRHRRSVVVASMLGLLLASAVVMRGANNAAAADTPPDFTLHTLDGRTVTSASLRGKVVVLEWFNFNCPFVQRAYTQAANLAGLQREAVSHGVEWYLVNSTGSAHRDYPSRDSVAARLKEWKIDGPAYVDDHEGALGHQFEAKTTPSFVVVDRQGQVAYRGALDNFPELNGEDDPHLIRYLRDALEQLWSDKPVAQRETAPYGCSIKYSS